MLPVTIFNVNASFWNNLKEYNGSFLKQLQYINLLNMIYESTPAINSSSACLVNQYKAEFNTKNYDWYME
mgnify:CR=1 FL=1